MIKLSETKLNAWFVWKSDEYDTADDNVKNLIDFIYFAERQKDISSSDRTKYVRILKDLEKLINKIGTEVR